MHIIDFLEYFNAAFAILVHFWRFLQEVADRQRATAYIDSCLV